MPGHHTFYGGSRLLEPLASLIGLRLDQINFVVSQWITLIFAVIYNFFISKQTSRSARLFITTALGISVCLFCFGTSVKHLLADGVICYFLICFIPAQYVHKFVFIFAMGYLSYIHWYRVYHAQDYLVDITGPMMVLTQKVTSLACNVHDGCVKSDAELTNIQKKELVRKVPSCLEYFCYLYSFLGILIGPLCFYSDFINFMDGHHYESVMELQKKVPNDVNTWDKDKRRLNPLKAVHSKAVFCVICLLLDVTIGSMLPFEAVLTMKRGFPIRITYVVFSLTLIRVQYYYAWMMADLIHNTAGFGFNGYDAKGNQKWDLISNIDVKKFETADNLRECLEGWNCGTMYWLKRVAYERTPKRYRTMATYTVSAWWHGFYPGYYATFLTGALFTEAARTVRRCVRPYFLDSVVKKRFYDVVTFISVRIAIGYAAATFVLLHIGPTLRFYKSMYFSMHILALCLLTVVPLIVPSKKLLIENPKKDN